MEKAIKTLFSRQTLYFLPFLGLAVLFAHFFTPEVLAADPGGLIKDYDVPSRLAGTTGGETDFRTLLLTFIDFFLGFLGLLAVLMVIYGGFIYMTAAGDETKTGNAKNIILYSIIGIIIILLAFALVNTLLSGLAQGTD